MQCNASSCNAKDRYSEQAIGYRLDGPSPQIATIVRVQASFGKSQRSSGRPGPSVMLAADKGFRKRNIIPDCNRVGKYGETIGLVLGFWAKLATTACAPLKARKTHKVTLPAFSFPVATAILQS